MRQANVSVRLIITAAIIIIIAVIIFLKLTSIAISNRPGG